MPAYADHDAEQVAHGIRLGGRGQILDKAPAGQPLTVSDLERLTRPDICDNAARTGIGDEEVGALRLYKVTDTYTIATEDLGWLPGHYVTRDAALVAYGYVLGGETAGPLDKLAQPRLEGYTLAEIETFTAA